MKLRLLSGICAIAVCAIAASAASADPNSGPPICNGTWTAVSGTYTSLTITGNKYVPAGSALRVAGNLAVAPGACVDAYTTGTVTVDRNLLVGNGAILGLGCAPFEDGEFDPCGTTTTNDTVGGSLIGDHPYTIYLSADTIRGNLTRDSGGPGATFSPYVNYPIKDSVIGGNVSISGWQGAWFGFLRNKVGGNAIFSGIVGANPDSNEIATNTVGRNLICQSNSPAAQLGDSGGMPNAVAKHKIGQCAGL